MTVDSFLQYGRRTGSGCAPIFGRVSYDGVANGRRAVGRRRRVVGDVRRVDDNRQDVVRHHLAVQVLLAHGSRRDPVPPAAPRVRRSSGLGPSDVVHPARARADHTR